MILAVIVGVFVVSAGYVASHQAAWQVEAAANAVANTQLHAVEATEAAKRAVWFTDFYRVLFTGLLVVGVGGTGVYAWKVIDERTESKNRMVDGAYPLSTYKNAQGQQWNVDINKSQFGAIGFDKSSGQLITDAALVGPDRQLTYVQSVQRTRTAQATDLTSIRTSAAAKAYSGYYDRPQRPEEYRVVEDEPEQLTVAPWQPLTLADAFAQSTADRWLLGQNDTGACEFNIGSIVHAAILGSSNSGKSSSTGLLMAANARRQGMNVIALDAANGIDWNPYSDTFEVYETDHRVIGDQLNQIIKIHDRRKKACALAGVKTIYQLDYQMPSMLVIMEEFGRLMQSFKNVDPDNYENIVVALTVLMSDSRKSGISFLFIDQGMQVWDKRFKTNIRDYIAYKMNARQGSAFDAYDLHKLKPQGQFWRGGEIYDAWHTAPQFNILQKELQPQRVKLLTDSSLSIPPENQQNGSRTVLDTDTQNSHFDVSSSRTVLNGSLSADNGSSGSENGSNGSRTVLSEPPRTVQELQTVLRVYRETGSKTATCKIIWGMKNGKTYGWLNEILQGGEVQQ
jgi:hypothetical protein